MCFAAAWLGSCRLLLLRRTLLRVGQAGTKKNWEKIIFFLFFWRCFVLPHVFAAVNSAPGSVRLFRVVLLRLKQKKQEEEERMLVALFFVGAATLLKCGKPLKLRVLQGEKEKARWKRLHSSLGTGRCKQWAIRSQAPTGRVLKPRSMEKVQRLDSSGPQTKQERLKI